MLVAVAASRCGAAHAEPAETVEEEVRRALTYIPTSEHGLHGQLSSQLTGGTTIDEAATANALVSVGGQARYTGARCDYLRVGGAGNLTWTDHPSDEDPTLVASAEQWASVCAPITVMELTHHLQWDVRPALLAPLGLRPGTNRRETVGFHWLPLRFPVSWIAGVSDDGTLQLDPAHPNRRAPTGDFAVFDIDVQWAGLWTKSNPTLTTRDTIAVKPFRYLRRHQAAWGESREFAIDLFASDSDFVDAGSRIGIWVLRIENLQLGPLYATAGGGFGSVGVGEFVSAVSREVSLTKPRGEFALEAGTPQLRARVHARADLAVVADGYTTWELRTGGALVWQRAAMRSAVEGVIARTDIYAPGSGGQRTTRAITGGAALDWSYGLTRYLQATLRIDVARSFYAGGDAMVAFAPRWGAQALAGLAATAAR